MTKAKQRLSDGTAAELRTVIKPGDVIYCILRSVSRSGMRRSISLIKVDSRGHVHHLDGRVAELLGYPTGENGIIIRGVGMDMGASLVYDLSLALYGGKNSYPCLGDRCPAADHVNDRRSPRGRGVRHHDGYALRHRWL